MSKDEALMYLILANTPDSEPDEEETEQIEESYTFEDLNHFN